MSAPFTYQRQARSLGTAVLLGAIWTALIWARVALDAAFWIVALFALFTLPALVDLMRDPASGLTLDDDTLHWHSGRRSAAVDLSEIAKVRLDTRLDLSVRATVELNTGRKIRIPFESTPPHQAFEDELQARGIKVERYHFQLMQ